MHSAGCTADGIASRVLGIENAVPAFSSSGAITLPVARLQIDITDPTVKTVLWDLTVGYDPPTSHYFWRYGQLTSPDHVGDYI